jgi:superfamily II DNA/RNA helicase
MFIKNEAQAEHFKQHIGDAGTIAMAKKMTSKERLQMTHAMKSNEIKRCLATDIYATGVTFNHVRAVFNLSGGGPYASTIQKPGRVVEVRDGKRCGVLFDFNFVPKAGEEHKSKQSSAWDLVRESKQRLDCYTRKGYDIQIIKSFSELNESFKELCL